MKITIVGGGNIGTQFAVHCAEKGHEVTVFTSCPSLFKKTLQIVDESGSTTHTGEIALATDLPQKAFSSAELIFVTYPANMVAKAAEMILKYAAASAFIGVVPGNGGSECAFQGSIRRGNIYFAIERVPAVARLVVKGQVVKSTGYRNELHLASIPADKAGLCCRLVSDLFNMRCIPIPHILNLTMTPSNPILHTTRLYTLFRNYHDGVYYTHIPLFYEDWDNASSEMLLRCDEEVQKTCRALSEYPLQYVKSLKEHYESPTASALTEKISSIPAFRGIQTPSVQKEGGLSPDLHSRYFTADFSYGLKVIQQIAEFAGVSTPSINSVMDWYHNIALEQDEFSYSNYDITTRREFDRFYLR